MANIGYFNDAKKEYVITNMRPRRPLSNYLWNELFLANLDNFGFGESFLRISPEERRVLFPCWDATRLIYIKDKATGEFFDINRNYQNKEFTKFECHVGIGYQQIVSEYKGIETEFTITVPTEGHAELWRVRVKNTSNEAKSINVVPYGRPAANVTTHLAYGHADYEASLGGLYYYHDAFAVDHNYSGIYMKASELPLSYDLSDLNFRGFYNTYENPVGMANEKLSNKGTSFDDSYCCAMQFEANLAAGEEKTYYVVVGISTGVDNAIEDSAKYLAKGFFEETIAEVKRIADDMDRLYVLNTPDEYINTMINTWLKRQISLGKTWGRVCSKGFRDIMQDAAGLAAFDGKMTREKIILCLTHQRPNGNPMRAFDPIARTPYYDGAAWIPATILAYINETGDLTVLDEVCPYFECEEEGTVFDHMYRGIRFLLDNRGARNMVLWGGGDWNDSINNTGYMQKGESAWLSIATVKAITEFCRICEIMGGKEDLIAKVKEEQAVLKAAILENAFEGDQFIYGITDWDEKVGSKENIEGQTYLDAQTWAVLANMLDKEGLNKVMQTVEDKLKCSFGYVQCAPAYSKKDEHIGRMAYFIPGGYENGSVYNHGVAFKLVADCMLGKADVAYDTLKLISYDNPANDNSGVEPYVVTNMYLGPQDPYRPGFSYYSWITGTAGWIYRGVTEFILGVSGDYTGLKIKPCIPSVWNEASVSRVYRGAVYNITFKRTGNYKLIVDGTAIDGCIAPIFPEGSEHTVVCEF
ncbi:MAG: hypothetical protein IKU30_05195 [Clostridia bacterium]|nr:hypothetical protein [Clostridia bacterium]